MKENIDNYSQELAQDLKPVVAIKPYGRVQNSDFLVCIANIETGEVLRVDKEVAFEEFIWKKDSKWFFTNKQVYKQYLESRKPDSNTSAPVFIRKVENENGEDMVELHNVFVGFPSARRSKKRSSSNKKGKHYYQHVKANTIKDSKGEEVFKHARTIKHAKY